MLGSYVCNGPIRDRSRLTVEEALANDEHTESDDDALPALRIQDYSTQDDDQTIIEPIKSRATWTVTLRRGQTNTLGKHFVVDTVGSRATRCHFSCLGLQA